MVCSALLPRPGLLEWPDFPCISSFSIMMPLCMAIGFMPVGSPIKAARALGLPAAASARAPPMEDSSSAVARIIKGCCKGLSRKFFAASMARGKKPFMSQTPRP